MRRFANCPSVLLTLAAIGTATALAAPERTRAAGLDFWNVADDEARLRAETGQRQDLEFEHQLIRERNAIVYEIARNFCDERLDFREAIKAMAELAESSPEWFVKLKERYRICLKFSVATSDGAALARYLRVKIESTHRTAEILGDQPRATALSARLAFFDRETGKNYPLTPMR